MNLSRSPFCLWGLSDDARFGCSRLQSHADQTKIARIFVVLGLAASLFVVQAGSAEAAEEDAGLWSTVSASAKLDKRWSAGLAVQSRFINDLNDLERTLVRPSVSYQLDTTFAVTAGYDVHFIELPADRLEQRLWQQIAFKMPGEVVTLSSHTRLEERFIEDIDGTAVRLRLKARADILLGGDWYGAVSNEYFVGLNSLDGGPNSGFDQNRLFVGVGRPLTEHVSTEFGYQMQNINRNVEDIVVHQLVFSLTFR